MQDQKLSKGSSSSGVALFAFFMSMGTMASRLLGLVRESLFAALFPRWVTDAWYVAFKLPNIFRRLLGEGSLSVSFIPVFVEAEQGGGLRSKALAESFFVLFSVFLLTLTALGIIFMEPLLGFLLDPSYLLDTAKYEITLWMARIMFVYIYLVCMYAFFMAILNALGQFGRPALAPAFFNITMVISTLVPTTWLGWDGQAIAWGVVIGGVVQAGFLIPSLQRAGYLPRLKWRGWSPDLTKVFLAMGPGLLGMGLLQLMTLVNLYFASQLGEGAISYINLADRVLELPLSLISVSLGAALLPTLSRLWVQKDLAQMAQVSSYHLRLNLFLSFPAAIGLYVLSQPIIELLFQRGQFTYQETLVTSSVLQVYALIVLTSSLVRVFVPNFYAVKNTWFPALVSGLCLVGHVILAPILMEPYGIIGLTLSTVVASALNLSLLAIGFYFLIGPYPWLSVLKSFVKFCIPGLVMMFALLTYPWIRQQVGDTFIAKLFVLGLTVSAGAFIYFAVAYLLKLTEFMDVWQKLRLRIQR